MEPGYGNQPVISNEQMVPGLSTSNSKYSTDVVAFNCTCVLYILYSGYLWIIALGEFVLAAWAPPIAMNLMRKRSAAFCATNYLKNRINGKNMELAIEG